MWYLTKTESVVDCESQELDLHFHNLLIVEGASVVDHLHTPLCVARCLCTSLGLFNPPSVIFSPFLVTASLTNKQGGPAKSSRLVCTQAFNQASNASCWLYPKGKGWSRRIMIKRISLHRCENVIWKWQMGLRCLSLKSLMYCFAVTRGPTLLWECGALQWLGGHLSFENGAYPHAETTMRRHEIDMHP